MSRKQAIIKGAFILTLTGFATRFIGFFYRVFLSQTFGEEGVGLYQLIFPIYALGFSLTTAGIQTAISRCVASHSSLGNKDAARQTLYVGMTISVFFSLIFTLFLQKNAAYIASFFLGDKRCTPLLIVLSYTFPFASIHSCICGYYLGLKQTFIPAVSQIVEQIARVCSVYILYLVFMKQSITLSIVIAVVGLIVGEVCSCLFSLKSITGKHFLGIPSRPFLHSFSRCTKELTTLFVPLTANRVLLNILQSIEAVSIPMRLQMHGESVSSSLSTYGVLTGMALPCVLFPSAITSAVASMLLPTIAEVQALNRKEELRLIIKKTAVYCFLLGLFCCAFLLIFGPFIGTTLFHSQMAGDFILTMAWICPFLYTNNDLISIVNGLGKTTISFVFSTLSLLIRIVSVFFFIPIYGIQGYLWGMLASQLFLFFVTLLYLSFYLKKR